MAQAARQYYGYQGYADRSVRSGAPERMGRPDVQVIPGTRSSNPAFQSISPEFARAFKLALFAIVALALACSLRVWLSAATVTMLDEVSSLEATLSSTQAKTNELEIQHSILSSSVRIEEEASKIGMIAPPNVKYLKVVVPGKVVLNPDGSIAMAATLQNVQAYTALKSG